MGAPQYLGVADGRLESAVTCHRFCAGRLVVQPRRVQRLNHGQGTCVGESDGDKSPTESGDKSPHSKNVDATHFELGTTHTELYLVARMPVPKSQSNSLTLDTPIRSLPGVGPERLSQLTRLHIA